MPVRIIHGFEVIKVSHHQATGPTGTLEAGYFPSCTLGKGAARQSAGQLLCRPH